MIKTMKMKSNVFEFLMQEQRRTYSVETRSIASLQNIVIY